jgi:hypothetical protein
MTCNVLIMEVSKAGAVVWVEGFQNRRVELGAYFCSGCIYDQVGFAVERATRFGCRVTDFGFTSTKSAKRWLEENRELNEASLENFDPMTPVKWTNLPMQIVVGFGSGLTMYGGYNRVQLAAGNISETPLNT